MKLLRRNSGNDKKIKKRGEMMKTQIKNTNESMSRKIWKGIERHYDKVICIMLMAIMISGTVFAADNSDALWNTVAGLIEKWVTRLGGVVVFVGGVMFGLGWRSDDAEQKSRGISTMAAGGIVIAVAALTSQFFA